MEQLRPVFDNHTSVLSGVSGVGKSSITQAMLPHENIKVAEISATSDEGRHTTRTSRLYHLAKHGHLIDTPGIRGFKPLLAEGEGMPISSGFREISNFAGDCRFSNCRHVNEPGCAVLDAVAQHKIAESRYQNYLKMLDA
jgi:ribosome biogenesis GTPase